MDLPADFLDVLSDDLVDVLDVPADVLPDIQGDAPVDFQVGDRAAVEKSRREETKSSSFDYS